MIAPGRRLRVLLIAEACGGGGGRHVLDLAEGLVARDCEVHLIYSPLRTDRFFEERLRRLRDVRRECIPIGREIHPRDLVALHRIRRYIRESGGFDVIHGHNSKGGALARLAAFGTGTPVLYTLHGLVLMDPGLPRPKRWLYHAIEWSLSHVTDRIIAVSPEEQRHGVRSGLGRSRVILIPNGIDIDGFPGRLEARRALGLTGSGLVVGFIGRLVDQKAPDVLVRAFAAAAAEASGCRLAIVGSGPLESPLRDLARTLGIERSVLWLGERDGRAILPAFDMLAVSSRKEGLPYVVIEALAAGLPIVATRSSGVEILVGHGDNGLIVPPDRPEALAEALRTLLADRRIRERFGLASRARASDFTLDTMVDRTLAAYHDCLPAPTPLRGERPANHVMSEGTSLIHPLIPFAGGSLMASKPRSAELHPGPGFRVRTNFTRLDASLMREFREFATPDISDLLNRLYAVDPEVRCLTGDHHVLCGPACTVKVFPGDNLMVHKSLDVARPGDIVVVDSAGSPANAVLGDLVCTKAKHRKIAGFIVDGLVRDLPAIVDLDYPVFARGTTPIGPLHRGPGEINYPICCGGTVINPGDLIVADAAGIIVVPREIAPELLERLKQHAESNLAYLESVKRGDFSNQWVDNLLAQQNCPVFDDAEWDDEGPVPDEWQSDTLEDALINGTASVTPQA